VISGSTSALTSEFTVKLFPSMDRIFLPFASMRVLDINRRMNSSAMPCISFLSRTSFSGLSKHEVFDRDGVNVMTGNGGRRGSLYEEASWFVVPIDSCFPVAMDSGNGRVGLVDLESSIRWAGVNARNVDHEPGSTMTPTFASGFSAELMKES